MKREQGIGGITSYNVLQATKASASIDFFKNDGSDKKPQKREVIEDQALNNFANVYHYFKIYFAKKQYDETTLWVSMNKKLWIEGMEALWIVLTKGRL